MWQIVAFNRTGTRPALNQAVGYVRVAHIVLRGPLGPLSPTAASGWTILKMAVSSTKMATGSPCRVFSKTSLFLKTRYALPLWSPSWLPPCQSFALCRLKWMPVIRAFDSLYKYQSQTCHKLAAFGTLDIEQDCSFTLIFQKWNIDLQLSIFRQSTNRQFYLPKLRSNSF